MGTLVTAASPKERAQDFIRDFAAAPNDADIEIRTGSSADGAEPAVIVDIGRKRHGFTAIEALLLADIFEKTMHERSDDPETETFENIILALRAGANKAVEAWES